MRGTTPGRLAFGILAALLAETGVRADDAAAPYPAPTTGEIVFLPAPPAGSAAWELPGLHYRDASAWLALVCGRKACALRAVTLRATRLMKQPYDGEPVPGQRLAWRGLSLAAGERLVLVAQARDGQPWLAPRPVPSAYGGTGRLERPAGPGTLEARLTWAGESVDLVPRWIRPEPASTTGTTEAAMDLQWRSATLRQTLGTFAFDIEGPRPVAPEQYLLWAGDLDADGRLDLLVSFGAGTHDVALLLSSRAAPGQAVGEAGRFAYFPIEQAGC